MGEKIFNMYQGNKFIHNHCKVIGSGVLKGSAYIEFEADDNFKKQMKIWNNNSEKLK